MKILFRILIPIAILLLGIGAFYGMKNLKNLTIFGFKPKQEKKSSTHSGRHKLPPPTIRTSATPLTLTDHSIHIQSQGEVRTHNATSLTPQINGRVTEISPKFEDGAFFNKGDVLLKLETADYITELTTAKAQVARAEAAFALEQVRAKQALLNWKDAGFKEDPSDLVLRKPQLREAEANVTAAKSSLKRAERTLARTLVRAPYDGRVRKRNVGLAQQVGASTSLGEIFSTDFAEVRLPLTIRDLTYYNPPNKPNATIVEHNVHFTLSLTHNNQNNNKPSWKGTITRSEGALDEQSRQLFVIARIDDPFGLKSNLPSLYIGQPVRASIPAKTLKAVYTIPRENLSGLNEILVIRKGLLKRITFTPLWSGPVLIITRDQILPGDQLVTSRLPYAPEDAPVEIIQPEGVKTQPSHPHRSGNKHHGH